MRLSATLIGVAFVVAACASSGTQTSPRVDSADPRFVACGGDTAAVIAAFPMAAARDYRHHLPKMDLSPELDQSTAAFVVVFEGMWPGPVIGRPPDPGTTWPPRSLAPGTHDVCVWVGDAATGEPNFYTDVDVSGMTP